MCFRFFFFLFNSYLAAGKYSRRQFDTFLILPPKSFDILRNVKAYFLGKKRKHISKCRLLQFSPSMLSVNMFLTCNRSVISEYIVTVAVWYYITRTRLYSFDPLKPHFYIVKLGFTRVYLFFLFLLRNIECGYSLEPPRNIDCGYSLEPPRWGGSNEYPQSMFWAEIWKILEFFYLKIFRFWWGNYQ